jgi:four helix bundle protein
MGATHYRELVCWQLSHELKCEVLAFTATQPAKLDCDFCRDIRRSARSAPANIAEGFARDTHPDVAGYLGRARASLAETQNHLEAAFESGYLIDTEYKRLLSLAERAQFVTSRLQTYLLGTPTRRRKARGAR